jgi:import inner membrane translocase subunit TIM23
MGWAILDNGLESVRGTSDYYNHISAAFLSGFLFKSTGNFFKIFQDQ